MFGRFGVSSCSKALASAVIERLEKDKRRAAATADPKFAYASKRKLPRSFEEAKASLTGEWTHFHMTQAEVNAKRSEMRFVEK